MRGNFTERTERSREKSERLLDFLIGGMNRRGRGLSCKNLFYPNVPISEDDLNSRYEAFLLIRRCLLRC